MATSSEVAIGHTYRRGRGLVVLRIDGEVNPLALSPEEAEDIAVQLMVAAKAARERNGTKQEAA